MTKGVRVVSPWCFTRDSYGVDFLFQDSYYKHETPTESTSYNSDSYNKTFLKLQHHLERGVPSHTP